MKALGKQYNDAAASSDSFERLPAGGYVCRIIGVEDETKKEYLSVVYDIIEGQYKGYYSDDWGKDHPFAHRFFMSYKEGALGMFKGRLRAIDESNGTEFVKEAVSGLKEQQLVGKMVGLVIGYEEYDSDRGEIRERTYVKSVLPIDKIRSGDFKIPELKRLPASSQASTAPEGFEPITDMDLPF